MAEEIPCPEACGEKLDPRGLHGHLEHAHDYAQSEALETAQKAKGTEVAPDEGTQASPSEPADELDRTIDDILNRMEQREKVKTLQELRQRGESDADGAESGMQEVAMSVMAEAARQSLTGNKEAMSREDIRRVVREEVGRQPAKDGGGMAADPLAAAIQADADPDTLEKVAELDRSSPWADVAREAIRGVEVPDNLGAVLGQFVSSTLDQPSGPDPEVRADVATARQEAEPTPVEEVDTGGPGESPQKAKYGEEGDDEPETDE